MGWNLSQPPKGKGWGSPSNNHSHLYSHRFHFNTNTLINNSLESNRCNVSSKRQLNTTYVVFLNEMQSGDHVCNENLRFAVDPVDDRPS